MTDAVAVLVPLISANEPDAQVVSVDVVEGQAVEPGDLLAVVENTKSAVDVEAEVAGFVVGLRLEVDGQVTAGQVVCWLAPSADWVPPAAAAATTDRGEVPDGLRISGPALELARAHDLDLTTLPVGPLVTTAAVEQAVRASGASAAPTASLRWVHAAPAAIELDDDALAEDALVVIGPDRVRGPGAAVTLFVYGGGGHGRQLVDLIRSVPGASVGFVVDDALATDRDVLGVPVLGGAEVLGQASELGVTGALNAVGGIGSPAARAAVFDRLVDAGLALPVVVHPSAWVEPSALLAPGCQVFAHAYIGSAAVVGAGAIVNTGAVVSHDCVLEPCANISPGAILAGAVHVGPMALVGMGVTVNLGTTIGAGARIGNGATVKADVPEGGVVRAGESWPR